uniref:NADH-ubiquinone oxidoreductase chain 4L n=1 Tax=Laelaps chini TaxID=2902761 RepID=A0AAU6QDQ3_9ACAR
MSIIFLILLIGIFSFIWNQTHILSMLLSMEILILSTFLFLFLLNFSNSLFEMIMFYLILVICESCLGLSILILLINFYGSDLISSMSILKN